MGYQKIPNLYKDQTVLQFKQVYCLEKIHGCLHSDTPVLMDDGSYKSISKIRPKERVKVYNIKTKKFIDSTVKDIIVQPETPFLDWYELEFSNGQKIICTEDHPILTNNGWIQAKNLTKNDEIIHYLEK